MTIHDPIEGDDPTAWFPSNQESAQLVACILACKDVTRLLRALNPTVPMSDRRGFILLLTPAISLLTNVVNLRQMLARHDTSQWPQEDRDNLRVFTKILKKRNSGPLRLLRNERSAHQDPDKFYDQEARTRADIPSTEILHVLRECLFVLILMMNHKHTFAWSRFPDLSRSNLLEVHQAGTIGPVRVITDGISEIIGFESFGIGDPALWAAKAIVDETISGYNQLAATCSPKLPLLQLHERDRSPG